MGADGHIRLMCVEKFIEDNSLSEKQFSNFFELIKCSMTYIQKFPKNLHPNDWSTACDFRRVITNYTGDNIYCSSVLVELISSGWNKGDWDDHILYDDLLTEVKDSEWAEDQFLSLARYLWNECYIDDWEVWT